MYIANSVKEYLDDLAARKPAPGGGSAAALEASAGCALISMVANYTISNKKYAEFREKASVCLARSEELRGSLAKLIDADVEAYGKLSNGMKEMEKGSPQLDLLFREACSVPLEICKLAGEGMLLAADLIEYGNRNLITDIAIAALMLESAFFGAKFNVYINLKYIKDDDFVAGTHKLLSGLEDSVPRLKNEILHASEDVILR
jgi:formiminotetrahydrofolate cyclodeaminase